TLLLAHAIELYLKAFLRLRGVGIEALRTTFAHDFKKRVDEASTRGLSLGKEEIDIAAVLYVDSQHTEAARTTSGATAAPEATAPSTKTSFVYTHVSSDRREVGRWQGKLYGGTNAVLCLLGPARNGRLFFDHAVHKACRTERRGFLLHGAGSFEHHCCYL